MTFLLPYNTKGDVFCRRSEVLSFKINKVGGDLGLQKHNKSDNEYCDFISMIYEEQTKVWSFFNANLAGQSPSILWKRAA